MSVEENLDFGRKRSNDKTSRKKEIIELLGLGQLLQENHQHYPAVNVNVLRLDELSYQVQVFFMDEPLAALDFARKQEILPYIATLKRI